MLPDHMVSFNHSPVDNQSLRICAAEGEVFIDDEDEADGGKCDAEVPRNLFSADEE